MSERVSREFRLAAIPEGMPDESNFELAEVTVPSPGDGEFVVQNLWMSVDPYMRGRMMRRESYIAGFEVGKPLDGGAIGRVVESRNDAFPEGTLVNSMLGWRETFLSDGNMLGILEPAEGVPLQAYLGVLGMPGLTAYAGLLNVARLGEGENVFVSAASGAVGASVCQIAKIKGCYVVGSAGSSDKCSWLEKECGVDSVINYRETDDLVSEVKKRFSNGIDVYFENVGGLHLVAALESMNFFGRIAMCGMISQYNDTTPSHGPSNIVNSVVKSLRIEGFVVSNYLSETPDFRRETEAWIEQGRLKWKETVLEGIEKAPEAFLGLFSGANFGKMLVKLSG
ncbi:MAG: NADP-dependent oxidoreductase [Myxococcota bacterium]